MKKMGIVLALGLAMVAMSLLPVAEHARAEMEVEVGDYWKYDSSGEAEGMALSGTIKMKVTDIEGSGSTEVFVLTLTGSGDLTGSYGGFTVSGSVEYSGTIKRMTSTFNLVSSDLEIAMSMKMQGETMKMTMGILQSYSPPLDDCIGDVFPGYGAHVVTTSTVTSTTSLDMEVLGQHMTENETTTGTATQIIQIADENETVDVPAGEFDCYKYSYSMDLSGSSAAMTYYYSSEVGNYVKSEGSGDFMTGLGSIELLSYSYAGRGSGGASLFSGASLFIIVFVVVAVVVLLALVLMMRGRGRAPMQMMPPPQMGPPPPPPPSA